MKNTILILALFLSFGIAKGYAQSEETKKSDATWEETISWLQSKIDVFNIDEWDERRNNRYSFMKHHRFTISNNGVCKYKEDLRPKGAYKVYKFDIMNVERMKLADGTFFIWTKSFDIKKTTHNRFEPNLEWGTYNETENSFYFKTKTNEDEVLEERLNKAFNHLIYLASKKREEELKKRREDAKASGEPF